jgi:glycosyltransferase involved in cell wall biosynthesis
MPVYNAKPWLSDALRSVFMQSAEHSQVDLVVVDDGSTDGSYDLARHELENSGFRFQLLRTENGGPSRARNLGWRNAQGSWIQFLDADDQLHLDKIALQIQAAADLPAEVAVVYSDWERLSTANSHKNVLGPGIRPCIGTDPVCDLLHANFLQVGSYLVRRDWLERVSGFDESYQLIEDVNLLLRIAMAGGRFQHVPSQHPLFLYRLHTAGSLSKNSRTKFVEGCLRNTEMVEAFWRSRSLMTPSHVTVLAQCYYQAARFFAEVNNERFEGLANHLNELIPGFVPEGPPALRSLSKLIGYPLAEKSSVVYRRLKANLPPSDRFYF